MKGVREQEGQMEGKREACVERRKERRSEAEGREKQTTH